MGPFCHTGRCVREEGSASKHTSEDRLQTRRGLRSFPNIWVAHVTVLTHFSLSFSLSGERKREGEGKGGGEGEGERDRERVSGEREVPSLSLGSFKHCLSV